MKVLIIDNNDSFTYNLAQLVEQTGLCELSIKKADRLNLSALSMYDKLLISPGPGLPKDFPNLSGLLNFYSSTKSILGICLGHQAIAEYFGASLINLQKVYHGVTKKVIVMNSHDYLFRNIPVVFKGGLYHSWAVAENNFPHVLDITARSENGIIMSFSHRTLDVKGIQFHPESIMTNVGKTIIFNWLNN